MKKKQKKKPTIYAFIDSQNLNLGVRKNVYRKGKIIYRGWKLDFRRFRTYLEEKYGVEKAFLFIGYVIGNEGLYANLQKSGYIVIFKPTLEIKKERKTKVKGNVDAELILHAMIEYPNYDKAIIVSGDGDFRCLIEHLEENEKLFKIIIPNQKIYSSLLIDFRKYMLFMNPLRGKLRYKRRK